MNIATRYGLEGPRVGSRWGVGGGDFMYPFSPALEPTHEYRGSFPGGKAAGTWR